MSDTPIGYKLRVAMSEHDTQAPSTPDELRTLATELEEACIAGECQFSHPDWRYVDGLRALAAALDARDARIKELEAANEGLREDLWKVSQS